MKSLSDILKNKTFTSPLMKGVQAAHVIEIAKKQLVIEFGEGILEYASPIYFKNDTLTIAFLSGSAAQELRLREEVFLGQLNKVLGGKKVLRIKYMI